MTKQLRNLVITTGVVAVLAGACVFLIKSPLINGSTANSSETSSDTSIKLFSADTSDITKISVKNSKGSFTLVPNDNGDFIIKEYGSKAPIDTTKSVSAVDTLSDLKAIEKMENTSSNLDDYGLNDPQAEITISTSTGKIFTLEVGDKTPLNDDYYVMVKGSNDIYITNASFGNYFFGTAMYYIDTSLVSVSTDDDMPNITTIDFGGTKRTPFKIKVDTVESTSSTSSGSTTSKTVSGYTITSPVNLDGDTNTIKSAFDELSSLSASDVVDLDVSKSNLSKYGLSDPYYTFSYTLSGDTTTMEFGKTFTKDSTEYVYVMVKGINAVYDIETSSVDFYSDAFTDIASRNVILPSIDTVDSVVVTEGSDSWKFNLSGEDNDLVVKYNGTTMVTDNFRKVYEDIIGTETQGGASMPANTEPYITITYNYRDSDKASDIVKYYKINATKYFVTLNGKGYFYVLKSDLNTMIEDITSFVSDSSNISSGVTSES